MAVKGRPPLRVWELTSNSTRYDNLLAAPSDRVLHAMWSSWAGIALSVGLFVSIVFLGMLSSPLTRTKPFNVYLLAIMFPDIVFSLCCGVTCLLNALNGEYWSTWMCNFQTFYCVFGIGANAWLNAVIAFQLHRMLKFSRGRRRYTPPKIVHILRQTGIVYVYTAFLGTWGIYLGKAFPSAAPSGLACIPIEVDKKSSFFFWLIFFPIFVAIPVVYVIWVGYDVMFRSKLLPPSGKRRQLSVYFGRLVLAFIIMWLPTFLLLFVAGSWLPPWVHWVGGTWSHLQGAVSMSISLMRKDIRRAVSRFLKCQCRQKEEEELGGYGRGRSSLYLSVVASANRGPSMELRATQDPDLDHSDSAYLPTIARTSVATDSVSLNPSTGGKKVCNQENEGGLTIQEKVEKSSDPDQDVECGAEDTDMTSDRDDTKESEEELTQWEK